MRTGHTKLLFAACLGCTAYNMAAAQKAPTSSIPTVPASSIQLRFVNTDVSDVLQAISVQAHANIVFPAQLKKLISINLAANSTKSALSFVAAAGGLAFRYASGTYVVALPTDLRQGSFLLRRVPCSRLPNLHQEAAGMDESTSHPRIFVSA